MTAPFIWIVIPGMVAATLFFVRRYHRLTTVVAALVSGSLGLAALKTPIGEVILVGPLSFKVVDTLTLLGRLFIINNSQRPVLGLIYLSACLWIIGSYLAHPGSMFVPTGLGIVALMTAALSVQPFLYAALLFEMAALLCVPLLAPPGIKQSRGVMRFITFQTLGAPFILFSGWVLSQVDINPTNQDLIVQAGILTALGFSFLMAIFPFHSWIPMLSEEAHPYAAAFVFFMLPGIVSLFGLSFLTQYAWLRDSSVVFSLIRSAGLLMVVTGGVFAAFQRHLGRLMGYGVIVDLGTSFLALGVSQGVGGESLNQAAINLFYTLFISRGLALGLWALALSELSTRLPDLSFISARGLGKKLPLVSASLILAQLSMTGFPLLAGFSQRLAIWQRLAQISPASSLWTLFGCAALAAGAVRLLSTLSTGEATGLREAKTSLNHPVALSAIILVIFAYGLIPH